jgi:type IV secretory pathway VirB4 component
MSSGILRTRNSAITQLVRVNEGTSKAKREELAKVNGYYINPALVGIAYDRICFATLHVIIGIQNSLLEHLTVRLRHHETACLSELSLLTEGRDNLLHHIAEVKQWRDFDDKDHKSAKQQRKEHYPLHIASANDKSISDKALTWRRNTRAPLYARTLQRKSKRLKTRKSCRHMRTLPKLFIVL